MPLTGQHRRAEPPTHPTLCSRFRLQLLFEREDCTAPNATCIKNTFFWFVLVLDLETYEKIRDMIHSIALEFTRLSCTTFTPLWGIICLDPLQLIV